MSDLLVAASGDGLARVAPVVRAAEQAGFGCGLVAAATAAADVGLGELTATLQLDGPGGVAAALAEFARCLDRVAPRLVLVSGDSPLELGIALAAIETGREVARLDAGGKGRVHGTSGPLLDDLCAHLLATMPSTATALIGRGIGSARVAVVGSTTFESVRWAGRVAASAPGPAVSPPSAVMVLDRDDAGAFEDARHVLEAAVVLARCVPTIVVADTGRIARLDEWGLAAHLRSEPGITLEVWPSFVDLVELVRGAGVTLTDSRLVQELAVVVGTPCLALAETTDLPVTSTVGTDTELAVEEALCALEGERAPAALPELWDGAASERVLGRLLGGGRAEDRASAQPTLGAASP